MALQLVFLELSQRSFWKPAITNYFFHLINHLLKPSMKLVILIRRSLLDISKILLHYGEYTV